MPRVSESRAEKQSDDTSIQLLVAGVGFAVGFVAGRLARRARKIDERSISRIYLETDQEKFPPFRDGSVEGVFIDGHLRGDGKRVDPAHRFVVIGTAARRLSECLNSYMGCRPAIARKDASDTWHIAVAKSDTDFGLHTPEMADEPYEAVAVQVGAEAMHLTMGVMSVDRFYPVPTHQLGRTLTGNIREDFPGIPIATTPYLAMA